MTMAATMAGMIAVLEEVIANKEKKKKKKILKNS